MLLGDPQTSSARQPDPTTSSEALPPANVRRHAYRRQRRTRPSPSIETAAPSPRTRLCGERPLSWRRVAAARHSLRRCSERRLLGLPRRHPPARVIPLRHGRAGRRLEQRPLPAGQPSSMRALTHREPRRWPLHVHRGHAGPTPKPRSASWTACAGGSPCRCCSPASREIALLARRGLPALPADPPHADLLDVPPGRSSRAGSSSSTELHRQAVDPLLAAPEAMPGARLPLRETPASRPHLGDGIEVQDPGRPQTRVAQTPHALAALVHCLACLAGHPGTSRRPRARGARREPLPGRPRRHAHRQIIDARTRRKRSIPPPRSPSAPPLCGVDRSPVSAAAPSSQQPLALAADPGAADDTSRLANRAQDPRPARIARDSSSP